MSCVCALRFALAHTKEGTTLLILILSLFTTLVVVWLWSGKGFPPRIQTWNPYVFILVFKKKLITGVNEHSIPVFWIGNVEQQHASNARGKEKGTNLKYEPPIVPISNHNLIPNRYPHFIHGCHLENYNHLFLIPQWALNLKRTPESKYGILVDTFYTNILTTQFL